MSEDIAWLNLLIRRLVKGAECLTITKPKRMSGESTIYSRVVVFKVSGDIFAAAVFTNGQNLNDKSIVGILLQEDTLSV